MRGGSQGVKKILEADEQYNTGIGQKHQPEKK